MEIKQHNISFGDDVNIVLGQCHFIKSVSDLAMVVATTVPNAKFAVIFCEASGPCLIRTEGNDSELIQLGVNAMKDIGAGHTFMILLKNAYPINILNKVKMCDEVVGIFCATANPLTVLTVSNENGSGIIGVIDGASPKGIETDSDKQVRKDFLKKIGYAY